MARIPNLSAPTPTSGAPCLICTRSRLTNPGLKLRLDKPRRERRESGLLCEKCRKALDTFAEKALLFQAIIYVKDGLRPVSDQEKT